MKIKDQISFYDKRWTKTSYLNTLKLSRSIKILDYLIYVKKKIKEPFTIDLGCGDGRLTSFIGEFTKAEGIELSEEAVRIANKKYPHVHFFQGNVLEYEFQKNKYDLVISQEVIEHIENQKAYFDISSHILKEGGYLIMTTPNKRTFNHMKGGNWSNQPIEKILTPNEFRTLVSENFKIIKYDSIIHNFGKMGYYKFINHRIIIGVCNRLGFKEFRERINSKLGFGLHQCVLAKKR